MKVEGNGGGHDIAAGGNIPRGREKQFVELVDEMVELSTTSTFFKSSKMFSIEIKLIPKSLSARITP